VKWITGCYAYQSDELRNVEKVQQDKWEMN
jgi:hypothetical protein